MSADEFIAKLREFLPTIGIGPGTEVVVLDLVGVPISMWAVTGAPRIRMTERLPRLGFISDPASFRYLATAILASAPTIREGHRLPRVNETPYGDAMVWSVPSLPEAEGFAVVDLDEPNAPIHVLVNYVSV